MKRFLDRPRNYCVNSSQTFNTIIAERNYEKCDNFNYSTLRVAHFPNYLSREISRSTALQRIQLLQYTYINS